MTPKILSRKTDISINHVSTLLKLLMEKELVRCENPEARKGRVYSLTELGVQVERAIKAMQ